MLKRTLGADVTFFPQPTTLIGTFNATGESNLMTASWVMIASKTPPTIAISIHHGRKTYCNIMESRAFSVNSMPTRLAVEADFCGTTSGHKIDKTTLTGLRTERAKKLNAPLVIDAPLNLECRYQSEQALGDYRLILGEIVEVHACAAAFRADGKMDIKAFDPLIYLGGIREYWTLGEKLADAYTLGKNLSDKADE